MARQVLPLAPPSNLPAQSVPSLYGLGPLQVMDDSGLFPFAQQQVTLADRTDVLLGRFCTYCIDEEFALSTRWLGSHCLFRRDACNVPHPFSDSRRVTLGNRFGRKIRSQQGAAEAGVVAQAVNEKVAHYSVFMVLVLW